jgi:hypothetical protein
MGRQKDGSQEKTRASTHRATLRTGFGQVNRAKDEMA